MRVYIAIELEVVAPKKLLRYAQANAKRWQLNPEDVEEIKEAAYESIVLNDPGKGGFGAIGCELIKGHVYDEDD